jgi:lysophospholipase L1-like esterase
MKNLKRYKDWISINEEKDPGYYIYQKLPGSVYRKNLKGKWEVKRPQFGKYISLQKGDVGSRIETLEKTSTPKKLNILFVGDSNTASAAGGKFYGWWIKNKLGDKVEIEKVAKGGEGTQWMIDNLKTHLDKGNKYDVISILGGSNDIWNPSNPLTLEEIKTNIKTLVEMATKNGAKVVVISPPSKEFYPDVVNKDPKALEKLKITEQLKEWEKSTYGDNFIDFNFITSPKGGAKESDFQEDLRHLRPQPKHEQLANLWINNIYWGPKGIA